MKAEHEIIEHIEWCPDNYSRLGFFNQKIAIVGHSHWSNDDDNNDFTEKCIRNVMSGNWRIAFFTSIAFYFGSVNLEDFWSRVLFFNFLPSKVGGDMERFDNGLPQQLSAGRTRVLRILDEHKPDKLFVFSTKAWRDFPPSVEDGSKVEAQPPHYWHTYVTPDGHRVKAVGLRHPQGANRQKMTLLVRQLMADI